MIEHFSAFLQGFIMEFNFYYSNQMSKQMIFLTKNKVLGRVNLFQIIKLVKHKN